MLLGIILLILLIVMSLVSSREVHDTLKETIVKASATQAIDNDATRLEMEDLRAKYQLVVLMLTELKQQQKSTAVNLTMHIDKSIDSLYQKPAEIHSNT